MNFTKFYDCLVTPVSAAKFYITNILTWGHHYSGLSSFKYVYTPNLKYKGCITGKNEIPTDNELKGYNLTDLIKHYCTPDTFEIIDIISRENFNASETIEHAGINLTKIEQSIIINAKKIFSEQQNLQKIFIPYDEHKLYIGYKAENHTFGYYDEHPIFYGFKGDDCSRNNIVKFLFNHSTALINDLHNNLTQSTINSDVDENNLYTNFINITIGLTAIVVSTGIGYLGYKLYKNYSTNYSTISYEPITNSIISDSSDKIEIAGVSQDIITEDTNF